MKRLRIFSYLTEAVIQIYTVAALRIRQKSQSQSVVQIFSIIKEHENKCYFWCNFNDYLSNKVMVAVKW